MPSLKFVNFPVSKIWLIFGHNIYQRGDLDLLIYKWGHGSPHHGLPSCQFSASCHSRLRVRHGTDRRTNTGRPSVLNVPPCGGEHNNSNDNNHCIWSQKIPFGETATQPTIMRSMWKLSSSPTVSLNSSTPCAWQNAQHTLQCATLVSDW